MTLELGHLIDEQVNRRVLTLEAWLRERPFSGLKDIIVAYSSITVFYDPAEMRQSGWSGVCALARTLAASGKRPASASVRP